MSIIFKYIWRNICSNRFRSLLIVFSLTLSAAIFYENLNIVSDARESTVLILQESTADYDVLVQGETDENALPAHTKTMGLAPAYGTLENTPVMLLGGDLSRLVSEGVIELDMASFVYDPTADGQAVLPLKQATEHDIRLGDTVTVETAAGARELQVTAFVENLGLLSAENLQGFAGVLDEETQTALRKEDDGLLEILFNSSDRTDTVHLVALEDDSDPVQSCIDWEKSHAGMHADPLYRNSGETEQMKDLKRILNIILLLVVAIAFYVITSTDMLIIQYRIPVMSTFRSMGATRAMTNWILIAENVLYGLVASIPGLALGELIRSVVRAQYLNESLGRPNILLMLLVPVFTVVMNILISLVSMMRTRSIRMKDLLQRAQMSIEKASPWAAVGGILCLGGSVGIALWNVRFDFWMLLAELFLGLLGSALIVGPLCAVFSHVFSHGTRSLFGGPAWLGIRSLGGSRINRSTSLLVATAMCLVMAVYISTASITVFFDSYANNYPYDLFIQGTTGDQSSLRYLSKLEGVDQVTYEFWDETDAQINGETMRVNIVANDGFTNGIEAENGLLENLHSGQTVVDRMFATRNGYEIGDTLQIDYLKSDGETSSFPVEIVGFCDATVFYSKRSVIVLSHRDYLWNIKTEPYIVGIYTKENLSVMEARLQQALFSKNYATFSIHTSREYIDEDLNAAFAGLRTVSVVPFLALLLALFGLVNNQLVAFHQKRLQYAALCSVAMNRQQLGVTMVMELTSSFLVGGLVGLPAGLWLTKIMRDVVFVSVAYVEMRIAPIYIVSALVFLFLLLLATSAFPLRRLRKMDIIKEIKYE